VFRSQYSTDGIPIRAGGQIVGRVTGDRFIKRLKGSRHMLREPRGWALDADSLSDAERFGAREVAIIDVETDITYSATVERIRAKGFKFDRGFGLQIALPLRHWAVEQPGARQLAFAIGGIA